MCRDRNKIIANSTNKTLINEAHRRCTKGKEHNMQEKANFNILTKSFISFTLQQNVEASLSFTCVINVPTAMCPEAAIDYNTVGSGSFICAQQTAWRANASWYAYSSCIFCLFLTFLSRLSTRRKYAMVTKAIKSWFDFWIATFRHVRLSNRTFETWLGARRYGLLSAISCLKHLAYNDCGFTK